MNVHTVLCIRAQMEVCFHPIFSSRCLIIPAQPHVQRARWILLPFHLPLLMLCFCSCCLCLSSSSSLNQPWFMYSPLLRLTLCLYALISLYASYELLIHPSWDQLSVYTLLFHYMSLFAFVELLCLRVHCCWHCSNRNSYFVCVIRSHHQMSYIGWHKFPQGFSYCTFVMILPVGHAMVVWMALLSRLEEAAPETDFFVSW